MHYYIDGYNLMYRVLTADDDLQTQRQEIIQELNEKIQVLELNATVVFDSQYQYGYGARSHLNYLEICFTDQGETADDYIVNELNSSTTPQQETVVTSDNKLAWRVRQRNAKTVSIEEFMSWLNTRYKKKKRAQKEKRTKPPPVAEAPPKPRRVSIPTEPPTPESTPEESFNYYLYEFEKEFKERVSKEKPKEQEEKPISETNRWLGIFEEKLKEEEVGEERGKEK